MDGLVEISGMDEKEPAKLLFCFGKRTVGRGQFFISDPYRDGRLNRLERLRHDEVATLAECLAVGGGFVHQGIAFVSGQTCQLFLLGAAHKQIFHRS